MFKPISGSVFEHRVVPVVSDVLEFRCSDLGDSSWRRTLSTLDLKE